MPHRAECETEYKTELGDGDPEAMDIIETSQPLVRRGKLASRTGVITYEFATPLQPNRATDDNSCITTR